MDFKEYSELYHHGVKGMRWGVRRYQNPDGSLTEAGKKKYGYNLDIKDKSMSNVAKIRYGEARRRYDYAKMTKSKDAASLKLRYKQAKRIKKMANRMESAKKLAASGETRRLNYLKGLVGGASGLISIASWNYIANNTKNKKAKAIARGMAIVGGTAGLMATAQSIANDWKLSDLKERNEYGILDNKHIGSSEYAYRVKKRR